MLPAVCYVLVIVRVSPRGPLGKGLVPRHNWEVGVNWEVLSVFSQVGWLQKGPCSLPPGFWGILLQYTTLLEGGCVSFNLPNCAPQKPLLTEVFHCGKAKMTKTQCPRGGMWGRGSVLGRTELSQGIWSPADAG